LREKLLNARFLYEDSDFSAPILYHLENSENDIEWKRPHQICNKPLFIENGVSRFDIKQGRLGN
jgi:hypothetical protein